MTRRACGAGSARVPAFDDGPGAAVDDAADRAILGVLCPHAGSCAFVQARIRRLGIRLASDESAAPTHFLVVLPDPCPPGTDATEEAARWAAAIADAFERSRDGARKVIFAEDYRRNPGMVDLDIAAFVGLGPGGSAHPDRGIDGTGVSTEALRLRLEGILASRSWRVTRPLRAMARLVRHGHADTAGHYTIGRALRGALRRIPLPRRLKSAARRLRGYVARLRRSDWVTHAPLVERLDFRVAVGSEPMRVSCCGLQEGLVSVVLPVYNQADLLRDSIDSVLEQTYAEFELIVINDGSTDGVDRVLADYVDHPRVRCFTQPNQRLPKALSNGFELASGEFWTWTSADNIMEPTMLQHMVEFLRNHPRAGMVYADYVAIDDSGAILQDPLWRAHNRPDPDSGVIRPPRSSERLNTVQDNFIGPCFMYRGWVGRVVGDYDPQLGIEDYDYWMRINAFFVVSHLGSDDVLYRYRVHGNSLSAQRHEHRIHEKATKLMAYERDRARFYRQKRRFHVDGAAADWLAGMRRVENQSRMVVDAAGRIDVARITGQGVLMLSSETASANLDALRTLHGPLAVLFAANDRNFQRLWPLLNRADCIALAPSPEVAERIRLVAPCPVVDAAAPESLAAVLAFAVNHLYIERTRTPEERQRIAPHQMIAPSRRTVLLQVDSFVQGGMENVVIDLGLSLQERGYAVLILCLGRAGDAADKARDLGLRLEVHADGLSPAAYRHWLLEHRVCLVNGHYSVFGAADCRDLGLPFVETIHNSYVWFDSRQIEAYRSADPFITKYICVSHTAAEYADIRLGLDVAKMSVVANGIDPGTIGADGAEADRESLRKTWGIGPDAIVYLNVASIMATKAQWPLLMAFKRLRERQSKAHLVLLGGVLEKPYEIRLRNYVAEHGLDGAVTFAGYQRAVASYYHAADVFVLPSYWEGWSLSLGEALANGLNCVVSDVGSAYQFRGSDRVEIVTPPFGAITNLSSANLAEVIHGEHPAFVAELAEAMARAGARPRNGVDHALAARLDRKLAYARYAEFFHDLLRGAART